MRALVLTAANGPQYKTDGKLDVAKLPAKMLEAAAPSAIKAADWWGGKRTTLLIDSEDGEGRDCTETVWYPAKRNHLPPPPGAGDG